MRRALGVLIVSALMIGLVVLGLSRRADSGVNIAFVSATNEFGFDVVTFRITNHRNTSVSGYYRLEWKISNSWVPVPDPMRSSPVRRFRLAPNQSADICIPHTEDMIAWRIHSSCGVEWSRVEQWRYRVARWFKGWFLERWIMPGFPKTIVVLGPEMHLNRPADGHKGR